MTLHPTRLARFRGMGPGCLIAGLCLGAAASACGQTVPQAERPIAGATTSADQITPRTSAAVGAGQISVPGGRSVTDEGQIASPQSRPAATPQLTDRTPRTDTPAALSSTSQSRNTSASPIAGRDRCDPVTGRQAEECKAAAETHAEGATPTATDQSLVNLAPSAASSDLVDSILKSGTGTIVQAPKP